jgi:hypothetical protein
MGPTRFEQIKSEMVKEAEATRNQYLQKKAGKDQYQATIDGIQQLTAQGLMVNDLLKSLILGLLLSVPGGIFFRK